MFKWTRVLVCAGLLAAVAAPLMAQDAAVMKRQAQNKLLAARAARVDAIRKLAERIKGLSITSETTVRDFVTENDQIETSLRAFLSGMREVGKPQHMEDGTCEVTLEVTIREVVANLKKSHSAYYKGNKVSINDFEKMMVTYQDKVFRETGMGAPRPEVWEQTGTMMPVSEGSLTSLTNMSGSAKAFWMQYCTGQGRLMAVRAARVDGMRRLAERIRGVYIDSQTTVRDFVAESDDINVSMNTFMAGARETGIKYHDDELIVEVEMTVKLRTVYASLKTWASEHYKGNRVKIQKLEQLTLTAKDEDISETGMGVPPEKYLKNAPVEVVAVSTMAASGPDWISQTVRAVGNGAVDVTNGNPAQAKLMAFRAAELDARRKLAEQLDGLMITSNTSVRDFVTENDEIETAMLTFQQGAHVLEGSETLMEDGTAQVTVEMDLRPLWDMVIFYQRKFSLQLR